jgi:multicomponent Na+:H+ antiporter subunit D
VLALLVLVPIAVLLLHNLPLNNVRRSWLTMSVLALAFAEIVAAVALPVLVNAVDLPFLSELKFQLVADDLTRVMMLAIGLVLGAAMLVGEDSLDTDRKHRHFCSLLLVSLTGMNATVLLSDFFSLYVFLEVTAVASFILIAYDRGLFAVEGALRYLLLSAVASAFMLTASGLLLLSAGGTSFEAVRAALTSSNASLTQLALGIFVLGLFIKGGVVPFHGWLPGAYASAPAPVGVLLSGIVSKVSGIYALIRMTVSVYVPDEKLSMVLLVLGTLSIVIGAVAALGQTDMKRMLAYSSISQVGYIILALGCGSDLGAVAATFHLFNHAVFKSLLFVDASAVESRTQTTELSQLTGIGAKMPVTNTTALFAMFSAAGIPPFAGFFSKLLIVVALVESDHFGFATVAVLASILTVAYFVSLQRRAFFGKPSEAVAQVTEASSGYLIAAGILATVTLLAGVLFPYLLDSSLSFLLLSKNLPW